MLDTLNHLWDLVKSFFDKIGDLFIKGKEAFDYLSVILKILPAYIYVPIIALLGVCIVYLILGRNGGNS